MNKRAAEHRVWKRGFDYVNHMLESKTVSVAQLTEEAWGALDGDSTHPFNRGMQDAIRFNESPKLPLTEADHKRWREKLVARGEQRLADMRRRHDDARSWAWTWAILFGVAAVLLVFCAHKV